MLYGGEVTTSATEASAIGRRKARLSAHAITASASDGRRRTAGVVEPGTTGHLIALIDCPQAGRTSFAGRPVLWIEGSRGGRRCPGPFCGKHLRPPRDSL